MNEDRQGYWNRVYTKHAKPGVNRPEWLARHSGVLGTRSHILDMGCGNGATTEYLISLGHRVVAADVSDVALKRLQSRLPAAEAMVLDFTRGLPWRGETFEIVVADLCLHYFDMETTQRVISDILRVLKIGGYLLARVNSVKDRAHGFGKGAIIEPNFFLSNGHYKRFFDRDAIAEVFGAFDLTTVSEATIRTRDGEKHAYEIAARKPAAARKPQKEPPRRDGEALL